MKTLSYALRRITFFLAAISATAQLGASGDKSDRTYLSPRSPGANIAHQYTTWHEHVFGKNCNKTHTSFQLTGFYAESEKRKDLGKYFGIGNGSNSFTVASVDAEVDTEFLMHNFDDTQINASGTVKFSPRQETWGARLDFFQDIHLKCAKFFISASLPIVHVKRSMHMKVTNGQPTRAIGGTEYTLEDFFSGNFENTAEANNLQSRLEKAKIVGSHSETGLADIELDLGWKALCAKKYHLFVNLGFTIPTSNKPDGEFLFEPIYGNGDHFGLGFGIDSGVTLWCKDKNHVRFLAAGNYRFLFNNTQKRTVGIKITGQPQRLDHYAPGFKLDQDAGSALFPLANILTQDVRVEPGSQIDALAGLSFKFCHITFDAGYNIFWRDRESVKVKKWTDDTIYLASAGRDTADAYDAVSILANVDTPINRANLDIASVTTPSLLSHKLFSGLAYNCSIKNRYPCSFGIGGSYEFANSNADLENWSIWLKAIFSF